MSGPVELLFEQSSKDTLKVILSGSWKLGEGLPLQTMSTGRQNPKAQSENSPLIRRSLKLGMTPEGERSAISPDFLPL